MNERSELLFAERLLSTHYPLLQVQNIPHPVAPPAASFVEVGLAEDDGMLILVEAVRVAGQVAAGRANGMGLGDVFGNSQQAANGPEGLPPEIHVEASDDDTLALIGQFLDMAYDSRFEKLSFIKADDGHVVWNLKNLTGVTDRGREQGVAVVGNDFGISVTGVNLRFEDLDALARNAGPFQPPDQLLGLSGEHTSADDFNPSAALTTEMRFEEHYLVL